MKLFFTLALFLCLNESYSQRIELIRSEMYAGDFEPVQRSINYATTEGSPYLDDELISGYVKFRLTDSIVTFLRYNIFMDEMEYLEGDKLQVIDNESHLDHVYVNSHIFYYKTYKFRNAFKQGYLEKVVDGPYELYLKYEVGFEKRQNAQSSYDQPTPDRFVEKSPIWFCSIKNGPIRNFETDKTGLEEIFREDYSKIKQYVKSEKLKLRKQEDMIKLFSYYNSTLN